MNEPITPITLSTFEDLPATERSRLFFGATELLNTIKQAENDEPMVHAEELEAHGLLIQPFWVQEPDEVEGKAYHAYVEKHPNFALCVRKGVAERLYHAQASLPDNWQLVLKAAFRPLDVQKQLFEAVKLYLHLKHPDWSEHRILTETRIFVSDYTVKVPPHCTGAAVDLEVLDKNTSELIDMGAPANTEGPGGWTYSPVISKTPQQNRITLLNAMLDAGFANYAYEWWHFSYGDAMWALFYDKTSTLYTIYDED